MDKELYIKFLNNRCTPEELNEVVKWIHSDAFREESRNWSFENWKPFEAYKGIEDDEKFSELFDKIRVYINKEKKIVKMKKFMITISDKRTISGQFLQMADQTLEVIYPTSSRIKMQLPDGDYSKQKIIIEIRNK